jgi:DNA polymerase III gamma/tau subunit
MSSDAATIVRRARELLSSKVDPLQLLAQLANLIMDILAGKHDSDSSDVRKVTGKNTCTFLPFVAKQYEKCMQICYSDDELCSLDPSVYIYTYSVHTSIGSLSI